MLSEKSAKMYHDFYDLVREDPSLDQQTTILVGLSAAMAAGCEP